MLRKSTERKFIRSVISRVHPDLFEGHKEEQRVNTESLKQLHKTVERLTEGQSADSVELKFYYREKDISNGTFQFASVRLTDSLVPLYEAFGVISQEEAEELRSHEGQDARNLDDTNFLQWLEATIQEASVTARDLANRKEILNQLQSSITSEFGLKKIRVGCQHGQSLLSVSDVLEQIDSLKIVQEALRGDSECSDRLKGLSIRVHCPRNAPVRDYHWVDYDSGQDHHISTRRWAEISSFGEVEVVAHTTGVAERLRSLDLGRARQLGAVDNFWRARQDILAKSVAEGLHVKFVWPDENCSSREFCLWAGRVLRDKVIKHELAECKFDFNLLVHSDDQAPSASFLPSSSTVQVHHHCSPRQLLELLLSNAAIAASNNTGRRIESASAEGELLQQARDALGARHVVRICGRDKGDRVSAALQRLVDNAATIRNAVNLKDVCLAIDDNFHLWDSGYVSIPYDFDVQTVVKEVTRLLAPVSEIASSKSNSPTSEKESVSEAAATDQAVKNAVSEAAAKAEAAKDAVAKSEEQSKKPLEQEPKTEAPAPKQQEPAVVAEESETGYESSDEDVARVYAEHSSAAEFIKSLRETDEESTGESVSNAGDAPVWPAPESGSASNDEAAGSPVPAGAVNSALVSHPVVPSPETSGSGELEGEAAPMPHPAYVQMPAHLHSATQKSDVELQPMFAAVSNGGSGEESLRAWLEGQSDCDMAGSALIASPGNSAELFGSAAYSGAPANAVVTANSGGASATAAIGPSVSATTTGTRSTAAGGSGNNGGTGRGRQAGSSTPSSRRRPSRGGRFAAVAGTLTALPKPTLPPFQAQWDMTPYGQVETPSKPPAITTPVGPDAQEEDPSERAAADHAQQIQKQADDAERGPEQGKDKKEAKVPQSSKTQSDIQQVKGDSCKDSKVGDNGASDAEARATQESAEEMGDADSEQDFHSHVDDLLKAVRYVKQRHTFKQNEGESAADATAGAANSAVPASLEAATAPVSEADPVAEVRPVRLRRGSTAAAEAAAEAAALLLGSSSMSRGQTGAASGADRGRTQDRVVSPMRASSIPQKQRNVQASYKPTRRVFAPAETASNCVHPTSFVRCGPNPAVANNRNTASDRIKQLFGDSGPRTGGATTHANKRICGEGARRPLHHLRRRTPAQQFTHVPSKPSAITPSTNTLRRSRSVSRASSLSARQPSFEFKEFPSVAETPALSTGTENGFTFGETRSRHSTASPPPTPRVSQFNRGPGRGRAHTCQPPQQPPQWPAAVIEAKVWPAPPQSSDQLSESLLARDKRMSSNAGVQAREQSRGRAGAARSLTPPPIRGVTEATAATVSRVGASCRSKSRSGNRGASALPSYGGTVGPMSSAGGGMWVQDTSAGIWRLSAPRSASQVRRTQVQRSCSAVRGRATGPVLR